MRAVLTEAADGVPAVLSVEGRVGIGKTALLGEMTRIAKDLGFRVFRAQCSASEAEFRFGVASQLFDAEADDIVELPDQAVLHRLHRHVQQLAAQGPVLLAVDDLEHADRSSLQFLTYLRRRLGELPVLLVVTRGLASDGADPVLLREIVGDARRIRLAGLDQHACTRLLRAYFRIGVTEELVTAWRFETGGNPYLLALRRREPADRAAELTARLRQHGEPVLALARARAVLGDVDLPLAAAAADIDPPSAAVASRALVALGFAEVPMVSATLLASMTELEQAEVHRRAALFRHRDQAPIADVADQLLAAATIGEDWVCDVLRRAARHATPDKAIKYLNRLLREPLAEDVRGQVLVELGEAQSHVDPTAARASLTEAAGQHMDASAEGRMALLLAYELAGRRLYPDAVATLDGVITRVSTVDPDLAQRLDMYALALGLEDSHFSPEVEVRIARLLGGRMTSVQNERFLNTLLAYRGGMIGANARETQQRVGAALPFRFGRDLVDQWSFAHLVVALVALDDYEVAAAQCEDVLKTARSLDLALSAALVQGVQSHVLRRLGQLREAESLGAASLEQLDSLGVTRDTSLVVTIAALVAVRVDGGNARAALHLLRDRDLEGELPDFAHYHAVLFQRGRLRAALGDQAGALRDHLECGRRMERRGARNPAAQPWRSHAALAHLALGDRDSATELAEQELALAREWGRPIPIGIALRALGLVTGSVDLLAESVAALRSTPASLELARSLVDWGTCLREGGRVTEAQAALRQGHDLAKRCGAVPLMGIAARELRASGGRPSRTVNADPNALTAQEEHIVRRAMLGLTNKQIADELFVTPRAVELHLTRAYRKLGISGRRNLADVLK